MKCPQCAAENPDGGNFCSACGSLLNPQLVPIVRAQVEEFVRDHFRDQTVVDVTTTEAIAERFLKWSKWFLAPATILVALLAALGFRDYSDVHKAAEHAISESKAASDKAIEAETKSAEATRSIEASVVDFQRTASDVKGQYKQLQTDADKYRQTTRRIEELQEELNDAKGNWKKVDLTVHRLQTQARPGESSFVGFGNNAVCPTPNTIEPGLSVALCAKGTPISLFQITSNGDQPVSSFSPIGFRDSSTNPKPACAVASRGTFYVEKGVGHVSDKPFLCIREADGTFAWIPLGSVP